MKVFVLLFCILFCTPTSLAIEDDTKYKSIDDYTLELNQNTCEVKIEQYTQLLKRYPSNPYFTYILERWQSDCKVAP